VGTPYLLRYRDQGTPDKHNKKTQYSEFFNNFSLTSNTDYTPSTCATIHHNGSGFGGRAQASLIPLFLEGNINILKRKIKILLDKMWTIG
jgi:hypothetical protein